MHFLLLRKENLLFFLAGVVLAVAFSTWYFQKTDTVPAFNQVSSEGVREIDMVTLEFKANRDGKEVVAQRWDPGTVYLEKGERVNLFINEINGEDHPFYIEGTDIKGVVKKGEETMVPLQFDKEGTYRLVCETHAHRDHAIPMIAYIVVN